MSERLSARRVRVRVAVLTYRRPDQLRRCLQAVCETTARLDRLAGVDLACDVLVVDNDPEGSAAELVRGWDSDQLEPGRLNYVCEPQAGIPYARNRALDASADCDALIFIDDDEKPVAGWPDRLVELWLLSAAGAVGGKVVSEFEVTPEPWVLDGGYFVRRSMPTGTVIDVCATNNLLLDLSTVARLGLRFDQSLGLGGGEDTLFTGELTRRGEQILWCEEAVVSEFVPASRVRRRWVIARSWSHGNTLAKLRLRTARSEGHALAVSVLLGAAGLARVGGGLGRFVVGALSGRQRHRARGIRSISRGGGMLAGVARIEYQEYAGRRKPRS